MPEALVFN